ncbi:DUF4432 domain-containing protein [Hydrogeniiclostridium mannosilyticum]|uniref:DUF4432 domain-containing protein n=1 Tax=Hydrogeniiclostridium mannosilyticum TaxID=2764322 RepID=A0A328U8S2_9FIRM|nr:DUF4432 domain-containing protein [Hydrogeniiclostridium mannosilyticum]
MVLKKDWYYGHPSQVSGVEEHRLTGGKGDGMRLLQVRNGLGLEFTVSADRCADLARLSFKGDNYGYFSPCGYVAPQYYDEKGEGFLKSFTAGFLTTCGLTAAGNACQDAGEDVPLHGKIGNTPAERVSYLEEEEQITLWARVSEAAIFTHKLVLDRTLRCSKTENKLVLTDKVTNVGGAASPSMMLYHFNMGYPLLCERSELYIPSTKVLPRNERAAEGLERWAEILPPQPVFEEQCYYHQFNKAGTAAIYNPELGKGLAMTFDAEALPYFVQWKMLGAKDYVMGLEPGNCLPDGRDTMRREGTLAFLEPGEEKVFEITLEIIDGPEQWAARKG